VEEEEEKEEEFHEAMDNLCLNEKPTAVAVAA